MKRKVTCVIALLSCVMALLNAGQSVNAQQAQNVYLDNRSSADAVIMSYVNAINRKEYARAYGYWEANATQLAPFDQFVQGYASTQTVQAVTGGVVADPGAGQIYYTVPVTLIATTTAAATQTFVGCYTLHLAQPGIQGAPPFQPIGIKAAQVQQVANGSNTSALMAQACLSQNGGQLPSLTPTATLNPAAIDASQYIDDRSDAVSVLRSLFNAVNRMEYVRAYSYWEPGSAQLAPFPQFQQGYMNTRSVLMTAGVVNIDMGAGQIYYSVPVALVSQLNDNTIQTFVGCYVLHLGQPQNQAEPPFQPLGIYSAQIQQVPNTSNLASVMPQTCS